MHSIGVPHVSVSLLHVETPLPMHWMAPGEHWTQAPFQHTGVAPAHVDWSCHVPIGPHTCATLPEHCVIPGPHTPVHCPSTHVWTLQSLEVLHPDWQVLFESQCCPAGHVCAGKRHCTHMPEAGLQNVLVAAHCMSVQEAPPVPASAAPVPLPPLPCPKPPYVGKPHEAKTTRSIATTKAATAMRKERAIGGEYGTFCPPAAVF